MVGDQEMATVRVSGNSLGWLSGQVTTLGMKGYSLVSCSDVATLGVRGFFSDWLLGCDNSWDEGLFTWMFVRR